MIAVKEKQRLAKEEAERQRRLEEIRKLKDKEERARREKEEADRLKRDAEERERHKRNEEQEKLARDQQRKREEEQRRRDEERKRGEQAMQHMAAVMGTSELKNIEHMISQPADPSALPSYLPVPSDLPPPPLDDDELPPPMMMGAPPAAPSASTATADVGTHSSTNPQSHSRFFPTNMKQKKQQGWSLITCTPLSLVMSTRTMPPKISAATRRRLSRVV